MRAETTPWWRQAQADIASAKATLDAGQGYSTSWFCQQATEKGLKALYVEQRQRVPPRTHDLEHLGRETGVPSSIAADLAILNPTFDMTRYPDPATGLAPVDRISAALGMEHLRIAEKVMAWINAKLGEASTQT
jgi:HEPN domain-containing protein